MEKIQKDFLWRRGNDDSRLQLMAWDRVCTPKGMGGSGFRRQAKNQALLCKWPWRFGEEGVSGGVWWLPGTEL